MRGVMASENRVNRLCTAQRLWSFHARKRGLSRRSGPPVHDDLVAKDFTAPGPNMVWLTDMTEHPTSEGKLYLCAVKDVWPNRIVGYSGGRAHDVGSCRDRVAERDCRSSAGAHRGSQRQGIAVQVECVHTNVGEQQASWFDGTRRRAR